MSLAVELARLDPDELVLAAGRGRVSDPGWTEEVVDRYRSLQDIHFVVSSYHGLLPPNSDKEFAGVASYVMSLGLVQAADAQIEASSLLAEIVGDEDRPGLHEELFLLTSQDIEDGADATFDRPLWAADKSEVADFFLWYPSLHELILCSAKRMVAQGKPLREMFSYINGGISAAQVLVEAGNARLSRMTGTI
jgi:hypothetical protein